MARLGWTMDKYRKMKLPVTQILSKNKKHYQIIDSNQKIIIPDIPNLEDALIIEECLNKYPKTMELLGESLDQLESWKREDEEDSFTIRRIKEHLQ